MKKIILLLAIIISQGLIHAPLYAQITVDTVFQDAAVKLYMVNLELSGMKYLVKNDDQGNRFLKFYNLNHTLWKTINCNAFPAMAYCGTTGNNYNFDALYISENLFDCDNDVEFMYSSSSDCKYFTGIYKEDGTALLIADSTAPFVRANVPQQFRPIYNTPNGTKLILSQMFTGEAIVYNLPCTLSTDIDQYLMNSTNQSEMNVFPNPSYYQNTVEYKLPVGVNQAEIIITDINGSEIQRYKVDKNFTSVLIPHNEIAPGTYFYSLIADNKVLVSKKIILLK